MRLRVAVAVAAAALVPVLALAVPAPHERRTRLRDLPALPSFVQRVEPAIVGLHVRAAEDRPSSARLGARRFGSAVVFDARGYAVTVSYVVLDAERIEASTRDGRRVPARLVGLDLDAGLGVVRLDGEGPWPAAALGPSGDVLVGATTGTVGVDEDNDLVHVTGSVQAIRRFSASWEYMLERAFLVAPASASWGGSALVDDHGRVVGIVSLRLGEAPYVNLAIPVERFLPVKDELIATGRVLSRPPRPWLGLLTVAQGGGVFVDGVSEAGPARGAGFRKGDQIVGVDGAPVGSQEEFYERLWRRRAGDAIQVAVRRDGDVRVITVRSVDRHRQYLEPR
ncbi:MAG TPA: S1C family serine protease [Methylomirabilota bacterium]|nr:S1C family serine protease [Methylomirabilota bacterium]